MTDGSGEDSELILTNTVKKKVQDWDFLLRRISLKHPSVHETHEKEVKHGTDKTRELKLAIKILKQRNEN